uniref:Putative WD repeat-containing protein C17D11.16 n=1 Tax=Lygus hesperus TaxID=30085 RepID=A0A0A9VS65_LYGHE
MTYDIRYRDTAQTALWSIQAHTDTVTSFSYNSVVPLIATASTDGHVKIWDTSKETNPTCLADRDMYVGKLFAVEFDKSSPFILTTGGNAGCLAIWDIMENVSVNELYAHKAEELHLGSQELPKEYVDMQRKGVQSKGMYICSGVRNYLLFTLFYNTYIIIN